MNDNIIYIMLPWYVMAIAMHPYTQLSNTQIHLRVDKMRDISVCYVAVLTGYSVYLCLFLSVSLRCLCEVL